MIEIIKHTRPSVFLQTNCSSRQTKAAVTKYRSNTIQLRTNLNTYDYNIRGDKFGLVSYSNDDIMAFWNIFLVGSVPQSGDWNPSLAAVSAKLTLTLPLPVFPLPLIPPVFPEPVPWLQYEQRLLLVYWLRISLVIQWIQAICQTVLGTKAMSIDCLRFSSTITREACSANETAVDTVRKWHREGCGPDGVGIIYGYKTESTLSNMVNPSNL